MEQAERALLVATLRHFHHHKERTAAVLGISLKTLYNRLKEYSAEARAAPSSSSQASSQSPAAPSSSASPAQLPRGRQ
jgi:hypothetical protein